MKSIPGPAARTLLLLLVPLLAAPPPRAAGGIRDLFSRDGRMRGVCFVAGPKIDEATFGPLVKRNVEWISQTPFGYLPTPDAPGIEMATHGDIYWGETDEGLIATTRMARKFGIRTLLKPHLWVGGWHDAGWSGDIRMRDEESWKAWFDSYRGFILHYAKLAQENGIEALAVGTELQGTTLDHEKEWRAIIREVRKVFTGRITYAANWDREFETLPFWDALDFAGIQAYFPLTDKSDASVADLISGWEPHVRALERLSARIQRPVVFTEIGYRSSERAAVQPWLWRTGDPLSLEQQARCYEAMFRSVWNKPWFRGAYVWKWFPRFDTRKGPGDNNFTPQGKPAEEVLGRWYLASDLPARPEASQP